MLPNNMRKMYSEKEIGEVVNKGIQSGEVSVGTKLYRHQLEFTTTMNERDLDVSLIWVNTVSSKQVNSNQTLFNLLCPEPDMEIQNIYARFLSLCACESNNGDLEQPSPVYKISTQGIDDVTTINVSGDSVPIELVDIENSEISFIEEIVTPL